ERDRSALTAIDTNLQTLEFAPRTHVAREDVGRCLRTLPPAGAPFDLVFVDPPYDTPDRDVTALVDSLGAPGWLAPAAIVCVERPVHHALVAPPGWRTGWERVFGDTLLSFCFR